MVDALPFRGLRFDPDETGDWGGLLGPPYDVTSPAQQEALRSASEYQITRIESPEAGPAAAADLLEQWRETGALKRDAEPAFYVTRHRFEQGGASHDRTTLFAAVRLAPWGESHPSGGSTKPHEWTMSGPKKERTALRATVRADISPVMVFAPDGQGALEAALAQAANAEQAVTGTDPAGEEHALIVVDDEEQTRVIREALAGETLYIADGHHRYESALTYAEERRSRAGIGWSGEEPENFLLMGIVRAKDPGLIVGTTHRLLHIEPPDDARTRLEASFTVEELEPGGDAGALARRLEGQPEGRVAIGVHGLGEADLVLGADERTSAALPSEMPGSWGDLGPAVLQFGILDPVFGVDDEALRAGQAVTYEHETAAAYAAVDAGAANVAFLLQSPTLPQIFHAADAGDRMPQKSTYFVPKLPTGVVLYAFNAGDDFVF